MKAMIMFWFGIHLLIRGIAILIFLLYLESLGIKTGLPFAVIILLVAWVLWTFKIEVKEK